MTPKKTGSKKKPCCGGCAEGKACEGGPGKCSSHTESTAPVLARMSDLVEAAKKRIKGNLCTGSGGFQACDAWKQMGTTLNPRAKAVKLLQAVHRAGGGFDDKSNAFRYVSDMLNSPGHEPTMGTGTRSGEQAGLKAVWSKYLRAQHKGDMHKLQRGVAKSKPLSPKAVAASLLAGGTGRFVNQNPGGVLNPTADAYSKLGRYSAARQALSDKMDRSLHGRWPDTKTASKLTMKSQKILAKERKIRHALGGGSNDLRKALYGEAQIEAMGSIVEAVKKRIKGNLCTGAGGFQACSGAASKRRGSGRIGRLNPGSDKGANVARAHMALLSPGASMGVRVSKVKTRQLLNPQGSYSAMVGRIGLKRLNPKTPYGVEVGRAAINRLLKR